MENHSTEIGLLIGYQGRTKACSKKKKEEEEAVSTDSDSRKLSYKIELEWFSSPGNEIQIGGDGEWGELYLFYWSRISRPAI